MGHQALQKQKRRSAKDPVDEYRTHPSMAELSHLMHEVVGVRVHEQAAGLMPKTNDLLTRLKNPRRVCGAEPG